jgi:hypothetical protein
MGPDYAVVAPMKRERFLRHPEQVAAARRFVTEMLARGSDTRETARLLVSETVTSMLDRTPSGRGDGAVEVAYAVEGHRRVHDVQQERGRGLQVVRALASRWGVREDPAGRTIWFELDLPRPR